MNSRRLMGTLSPRITPYHIAVGMPLCRAAKSTCSCPLWVISGRAQNEQMLSALPPKADRVDVFQGSSFNAAGWNRASIPLRYLDEPFLNEL